jgi:hypothetical protein
LQRRFAEAEQLYQQLDEAIVRHRAPERVADPLFDALLGSRVTRPRYLRRVEGLEDRTVTRNLARLTELGLLEPHGQTCGRYYVAPASSLPSGIRSAGSARHWLTPYPHLLADIRRALLEEQISG